MYDPELEVKFEALQLLNWLKAKTDKEFMNEELVPELISFVHHHALSAPDKILENIYEIFESILNSDCANPEEKKITYSCFIVNFI